MARTTNRPGRPGEGNQDTTNRPSAPDSLRRKLTDYGLHALNTYFDLYPAAYIIQNENGSYSVVNDRKACKREMYSAELEDYLIRETL